MSELGREIAPCALAEGIPITAPAKGGLEFGIFNMFLANRALSQDTR